MILAILEALQYLRQVEAVFFLIFSLPGLLTGPKKDHIHKRMPHSGSKARGKGNSRSHGL